MTGGRGIPRSRAGAAGALARRCAAFVAALALLATCSGPAAARPPSDASARAWLAHRFGGADRQYRLVDSATVRVAGGRASLWSGKFIDPSTGALRLVYVTPDGQVLDAAAQRSLEQRLLAALPAVERKSDDALRTTLASTSSTSRVQVGIWVRVDPGLALARVRARYPGVDWSTGLPDSRDPALVDEIRAAIYRERAALIHAAQQPVVDEIRARGGEIVWRASSAPLLFARLAPAAVVAVADRDDVTEQVLDSVGGRTTMVSAGRTVDANWNTGPADQGTGIRVGVVEYHNVRSTGDLAGRVVYSWGTSGVNTAGSHPTWVAGAIASRDARNRGVAPGAVIVSTSTSGNSTSATHDSDVIRAAERAIDPAYGNADIVNASFVQDTPAGHNAARAYFDAIAWEALRLPVAAAGNRGLGNYGRYGDGYYVGSPGLGWNVLTVGGIDDRQDGNHANDRIWYVPPVAGSSFRERRDVPYNSAGDFNKPNVSAPAVGVETANGLRGSGTSVATPIVSGIAAQLMARVPALKAAPHVVEALIMSGAVYHARMANGTISRDHEGVGTVSAWWANRSTIRNGGPYGGYDYGTADAPDPIVRHFSVGAGQRVRVALTWQSQAGGANILAAADALTADFDLQVAYPGGQRISASFDNAYEFVEFTAPATGTVSVTITARRFDAGSERWALAWTKGF